MTSDAGYKIGKFIIDGQAFYRASLNGEFIGQVRDTAKAAQSVCENHQAIMGVAA